MKKKCLSLLTGAIAVLLLFGTAFAQHTDQPNKMDGEMMARMHKSPHHLMMMAHRDSVLNFARVLQAAAEGDTSESIEFARSALVEIKDSMAKMKAIHQAHMSKMTPEMRQQMMPMMEKMQTERAAMKKHIEAIDEALQGEAPDAAEVKKHATALVKQLEKMKKHAMKSKGSEENNR